MADRGHQGSASHSSAHAWRILRQLFRLPPGYSKFLGDTVAQWALVEHLLSHGLYALLRLSPREGRIAVREPRAADRIRMIQQLAELRRIGLPVDCVALAKDLMDAQRQRDMLAHSAWFILEGTEQVFIVHTAGNWAQTQGDDEDASQNGSCRKPYRGR